jgi:hypothetical protein
VRTQEHHEHYVMLEASFHASDKEQLRDLENKTRKLLFDGSMRIKSEADLQFDGESSYSNLMRELEDINQQDHVRFGSGSLPKKAPSWPIRVQTSDIPRRPVRDAVYIDPALAKLRSTESSVSFSDDEVDSGERSVFLCDDCLVIAFTDPNSRHLCLDSLVPLATAWLIDDPQYADQLIIVWPGGTRALVPDNSIARTISRLPMRTHNTLEGWRALLEKTISQLVQTNALASAERMRCRLWVEQDGGIVAEQSFIKVAEEMLNAPLLDAEMAEVRRVSTTPKKRKALGALFGNK